MSSGPPIYIGIDAGTSGLRACAINDQGQILAGVAVQLSQAEHIDSGIQQDPQLWLTALREIFAQLGTQVDLNTAVALAVDGTSGTVCLTDSNGNPTHPALMYNDGRSRQQLTQLKAIAPAESPVQAVTAGLPKILWLLEHANHNQVKHLMHQADWLTFQLTGQAGHSDVNNCLKSGFDPIHHKWPDWLYQLGITPDMLPKVHHPGERIALINPHVAEQLGINPHAVIVAGTTDSHAAILATGIDRVGEAVTSLGSTLVTKVVSSKPVFNADFGVYSQPFGHNWLVGGASNSGGAVLKHYFSTDKMQALSQLIDPTQPTNLDYYPLLQPGERFPVNDPALQPRISPVPANEVLFFQALLEGIARIEHAAYQRLHELGAPYPTSVRTVGGGAINQKWTQIRANYLNVDMLEVTYTEAAYGSALLARQGIK